ncbi:MAG TPA: hypothetical protein DCS83_04680 [Prevotella sp.]|jgi:ATP-dependent DNA helicase RecG|nr:hypothetical protein [Prevotella sp.]
MANRTPFDDRGNPTITPDYIDLILPRNYLEKAHSKLLLMLGTDSKMEILDRMDLLAGPTENRQIKNVAAMMFSTHPEKFFPYTQIDVVIFPEGKVENPNRFTERTFNPTCSL